MALLSQGLVIAALGMGLVFGGLALLWGLMALLTRLFPARPALAESEDAEIALPVEGAPAEASAPPAASSAAPEAAAGIAAEAAPVAAPDLTAERAQVAAIAAAALMSNALPLLLDVPSGPAFEHGRTAPSWVSGTRARVVRAWQPPRRSSE